MFRNSALMFGNIYKLKEENCISQRALPSRCCSNTLSLANTPCHRGFYLRIRIKFARLHAWIILLLLGSSVTTCRPSLWLLLWDFTQALLAMWNTTKTLNCSKPEVEKIILAVLLNVSTKFQIVWEQQKFCSLFLSNPLQVYRSHLFS